MLKVDHVETYGWEAAIRGMRNPMNSWAQSDSQGANVGPRDLALMRKLVAAGTDHSKFMRAVGISLDVTAPMYWWKEFDTYRVGVAPNPTDIEYNSTSTMHRITAKRLDRDDFSHEHLCAGSLSVLDTTIKSLNHWRSRYLTDHDKDDWWQIIQLLPSTYNYLRTISMNYQVARNIYHARKNHKLDEWHILCTALEQLPCSKLITM